MATLFSSLSREDGPALIVSSPLATISHNDLFQLATKFQNRLANLGISRGHAVGLALPNTIEFAVVFLAATFQASAAPLNPSYRQPEFEFCLRNSKVPLILLPKGAASENGEAIRAATRCGTGVGEVYWDGVEVNLAIMDFGKILKRSGVEVGKPAGSDVAAILHTQETPGNLKATSLTHQHICETIPQKNGTYSLALADRCMAIMPLYHVHGLLASFLAPLFASSCVILPHEFIARDFWPDFMTYSATWYIASPAIHRAILSSLPSTVPKIRFLRNCSSALPPNVLKRMEIVLNAPVLEGTPTSHSSIVSSNSSPTSVLSQKPGWVGKAQGLDMQIMDSNDNPLPQGEVGEVCVLEASIAPGCRVFSSLPGFTKDGYFRTGDRGYLNEEGHLFLVNTKKKRFSVVGDNEVLSEKTYMVQLGVTEVGNKETKNDVRIKTEKRYSSDESESLEGVKGIRTMKERKHSGLRRLLTSCSC